jgi:hypothetical protein
MMRLRLSLLTATTAGLLCGLAGGCSNSANSPGGAGGNDSGGNAAGRGGAKGDGGATGAAGASGAAGATGAATGTAGASGAAGATGAGGAVTGAAGASGAAGVTGAGGAATGAAGASGAAGATGAGGQAGANTGAAGIGSGTGGHGGTAGQPFETLTINVIDDDGCLPSYGASGTATPNNMTTCTLTSATATNFERSCTYQFPAGAVVTVLAQPASGSRFDGPPPLDCGNGIDPTGDCVTTSCSCTFTITASRTVNIYLCRIS